MKCHRLYLQMCSAKEVRGMLYSLFSYELGDRFPGLSFEYSGKVSGADALRRRDRAEREVGRDV